MAHTITEVYDNLYRALSAAAELFENENRPEVEVLYDAIEILDEHHLELNSGTFVHLYDGTLFEHFAILMIYINKNPNLYSKLAGVRENLIKVGVRM